MSRSKPRPDINKKKLEKLYAKYNRRNFVHPDPLEFLYNYEDPHDREIAGLVASSLAYGNVKQILKSVAIVLDNMGPSPKAFLKRAGEKTLLKKMDGFKHRWTTGENIALMLMGIKRVLKQYGSLQDCFRAGASEEDETILPALGAFVNELTAASGGCSSLLPLPERGSACKRLNLFLRWMVRCDDVDPGGWDCISPAKLIVPLDTHMYSICSALHFTQRKQANMKTALEITEAFRKFAPEDPVRYDFALTRLGIRADEDIGTFLKECGVL